MPAACLRSERSGLIGRGLAYSTPQVLAPLEGSGRPAGVVSDTLALGIRVVYEVVYTVGRQ